MSTVKSQLRYVKHNRSLREELRTRIDNYFDFPLAVASIAMVLLAIIQITGEASPVWQVRLGILQGLLWALFVLHYLVMFLLAPDKRRYVKRHWLDTLVVLLPFVAWLRILAVLRVAPTLPLVRVLIFGSSSLTAPLAILQRRRVGQLLLISLLVILVAAAVEYLAEKGAPGSQFTNFGASLWWSASTITTVGSGIDPVTPFGRAVAFLLMIYGIGVFSYLTASIASVFVGLDQGKQQEQTQKEVRRTAHEVHRLSQQELAAITNAVQEAMRQSMWENGTLAPADVATPAPSKRNS
ncbi:MAG TPA: potassium channel family protein [Chloroflexota bacterium]|nr:potassium channel family protein [Chloroflexota bacterium]